MLENDWLQDRLRYGLWSACQLENLAGRPATRWFLEVQQFRVLATPEGAGNPTPEGIHQDARDYILMLLIGRHNVTGGESILYDLKRMPRQRCTLAEPLQGLFVADRQMMHSVTPIQPAGAGAANRDMLILSFVNCSRAESLYPAQTGAF